MSVINSASTTSTKTAAARTPSEYDGFWLNLGIDMGTEEASTFVRLPRGIAVSDLKTRPVYENMDPVFAAQVIMMNKMISAIQNKCKGLSEGDSLPVNMNAVLYRKQEAVAEVALTDDSSDVEAALFG
tara:strand:- start:376 stop:759 length:384 start_codon:yes stop_codon:yes gene_type:complete